MTLEDDLKVLNAAVREKRKRMGILQGLITKTMKGHKIARVNIKSGAILYQNKQTKESMGKKFIISKLTEYFKGDIIKATEVYNFLEENRGKRVKDNIKLDYGIIVNFPQPSTKEIDNEIEYLVVKNES